MIIYLIGSLRNDLIPKIANELEAAGLEVFSDWFAGGREADDEWMRYEKARGRTHRQALEGYNAAHVFDYDKRHLDRADAGVLVMPAGKSGHLEMGYLVGCKKPTAILFTEEPDRWDIMHLFATYHCWSIDELVETMALHQKRRGVNLTPWASDR
jgi:hypothetical protein